MISLFDTAKGQVTELTTRIPGEVSMYVCGGTVYADPHIGHGRFALVFDILRRYIICRRQYVKGIFKQMRPRRSNTAFMRTCHRMTADKCYSLLS